MPLPTFHSRRRSGRFLVCLCLLLCFGHAQADSSTAAPVPGGLTSMNGISLSQYKDFEKKWHFVTTRYRKDTGEMRFTYANDIAWQALLKNMKDYPEGAVFAKIGVMTQEDPAFASSAVPSGGIRYQFMVRNNKKYPDTHGWGYALFNMGGETFESDPISHGLITAQACNACHEVVPERGYVFSQPIEIGGSRPEMLKAADAISERIKFETAEVSTLPRKLRELLPPSFTKIRLVRGPLEEHLFPGTVDEIRPTLTKEVLRTNLPAALVGKDRVQFSVVFEDARKSCTVSNGKKGLALVAIRTNAVELEDIRTGDVSTNRVDFCEGT